MNATDVKTALAAAQILAPVIAQTVAWLKGEGPEPRAIAELPEELHSEAALQRMKLRAELSKG